jgi:hypothetical protein
MNSEERSDLEARLRALPRLSVPNGLEERLLASIPPILPKRDRSLWLRRIGTMAAAAGLLVAGWLLYRAAFTVPFRLANIHEMVKAPAPASLPDLNLWPDALGQISRVGAHELRSPFEWPVRGSIIAHPRDGVIDALLE